MTQLDRRSFLTTLGGAALAVAGCSRTAPGGATTASTSAKRKLSRVGIQLYTVRRQAMADLTGTLTQLARIGYKEIEFWGTHSLTPAQIRNVLDTNGLTSPSVHIGIPKETAGWAPIFDNARVMGHQWIVAASPPFDAKTLADWKRLGAAFTDAGKRVQDAGFKFAYHNHTEGFKPIDNALPFEMLLADTDARLLSIELDCHWAYAGGSDPVNLLTQFGSRIKMLHLKDSSGPPDYTQTDVGSGTYPWARILDAANRAGIQHYFAEHDSPADPIVFAKKSYDYLSTLEY